MRRAPARTSLGANGEIVELECAVEGNPDKSVFILDLVAEEVDSGNGGQFMNVSISPTSVSFANYGQPDKKWMMLRTAIQRTDLKITETLFELDESKVKNRRLAHSLMGFVRLSEITPWSDDVTSEDWDFVMSVEGSCEIVEPKRAF